jgi:DNA replicative helicase MCM subunit Mcm2 (Cdc46/Mcm family)
VAVVLLNGQNNYLDFLLVNGNGNGNGNNNSADDVAKEAEQTELERSNSNTNNTTNIQDEEQPEELSISDAIRRKKGYIKIKGQVIGHSSVYNMIVKVKIRCDNCGFGDELDFSKKPIFRSPLKEISKCPSKSCKEEGLTLKATPEYTTTIDVEIQDPDKFSEIERIKVRLFEDNTKDVLLAKLSR